MNLEFKKNVLKLLTGSTLAQSVPILGAPFLTRVYSPEHFGVFAIYSSIAALMAVITTLKYESSILLPRNDTDALSLYFGVVLSSIFFSFIFFVISGFLVQYNIGSWNFSKSLLLLLPVSCLFTGVSLATKFMMSRNKRFWSISTSVLVQTITTFIVSLLLGHLGYEGEGLVYGSVVGLLFSLLYYLFSVRDIISTQGGLSAIKWKDIKTQAIEHSDFPRYQLPSNLMSVLSNRGIVLLLGALFSPIAVGFYSLTQKVLNIPTRIISKSIGDVFFQQAAEDYSLTGTCTPIYVSSLRYLLIIVVLPTLIGMLVAPSVFALVFGEEWRTSGIYAQVILPLIAMRFICGPLSRVSVVTQHQRYVFKWQLILMLVTFGAILLGYFLWKSMLASLVLFSVGYVLMYIVDLYFTYTFSKGTKSAIVK